MNCQRRLFSLEEDFTYLNGAYMSPLLRSSIEKGVVGLSRKANPQHFETADFFNTVDELRQLFAQLIHTNEVSQMVVVPSVSYGMANVTNNLKIGNRKKVIIAGDQFPSNYYPWSILAKEHHLRIEIIQSPQFSSTNSKGEVWNEKILSAIDDTTLAIALPHVHWSDGTIFKLREIVIAAKKHGAKVIVDGTQSIGALPFDLSELQVDALIVSSYKWMMGPYGIGMAYYSSALNDGRPIENSWLNREKSDDFRHLVDYQEHYRQGARRYEMGQAPNFVTVPMLKDAMEQLLSWGVTNIQDYNLSISSHFIAKIQAHGWRVDPKYRAGHLFGIEPPVDIDLDDLKNKLSARKIAVSFRGKLLRISPNVYNDQHDFESLYDALVS